MNPQPILWHLEISHYNEKARWALDYKHVPHVRKAPPPLMHTLWALAMTRKPTFPVLRLNGKSIGDSTRIIEELERRYPELELEVHGGGQPYYPLLIAAE
jgi:glutathione S-transferase